MISDVLWFISIILLSFFFSTFSRYIFFPLYSFLISFALIGFCFFLMLLLPTPLSSLEIIALISVLLVVGYFFLSTLKIFPCHLVFTFAEKSAVFAPLKIICLFSLAVLQFHCDSYIYMEILLPPSPPTTHLAWESLGVLNLRVTSFIYSGKFSALLLQILPLSYSFSFFLLDSN